MKKDKGEHVAHEADDPMGHMGEDASMGRSRGAAHKGQDESFKEQHAQMREGHEEVRSGMGMPKKTVDADHVIGEGGAMHVTGAEGEADRASGKANRKEAMEPEREEAEKGVMNSAKEVPARNVMGHGQREVIARHTT